MYVVIRRSFEMLKQQDRGNLSVSGSVAEHNCPENRDSCKREEELNCNSCRQAVIFAFMPSQCRPAIYNKDIVSVQIPEFNQRYKVPMPEYNVQTLPPSVQLTRIMLSSTAGW